MKQCEPTKVTPFADAARWVGPLTLAALTACATHRAGPTTKPGSGVAEYRQIVVFSLHSIDMTLASLERLTIEPNRKSFDAFNERVHQREVDSVGVRARAQAMEARGDAYFAQ